jgi:hypothetical protein
MKRVAKSLLSLAKINLTHLCIHLFDLVCMTTFSHVNALAQFL